MTHYDTDYTNLQEPQKHERALKDIQDYLGERKYQELTTLFRETPVPFVNFANQLALFLGIQFYPADAWFNQIYGLTPGTIHELPEVRFVEILPDGTRKELK